MKLNHINLVVANVPEAVKLFETYFDFTCTDIKGDNIIAVLKGKDDFILVLMADTAANAYYPKAFHIGFILETRDKVNETFRKLNADGIVAGNEPKLIRDSFGFYFSFDNIMIEVGCYS